MAEEIAAIDISRHRLPLDPPFRPSWDSRPRRHFDAVLVRVRTASGLEGVGSGDDMVGFEGYQDLFIGADPLALERHARVLGHIAFHAGRCWPLDLALWDLAGKIAGQPCWKLLGGLSDRVRAYASMGTLRDPAALADAAEAPAARGFAALKIRLAPGDWRAGVSALESVRARLSEETEIMVDANQGWRQPWDTAASWTLKEAAQLARALEPLGIYWLEEPLHRADRAGMARLRTMTTLRIAGGEMTRELDAFRDLLVEGCLDVLQPDAALVGGLTGLRRIAAMAQAFGVAFSPHTWTNGLGLAANAHLAAGLAGSAFLEFPFDPPEWTPERRDFMLAEPLRVDDDGWLVLSERPGLGIELDEATLARTLVG
ncbi:MAG TPA: mandelate racemase/muconate lactonizing enzyme family protein [Caulobacteraceae bacterium]|nr:mandelate racemase/muconate lactonizing enzyme family protein [Caulobacteraceae bacterium]